MKIFIKKALPFFSIVIALLTMFSTAFGSPTTILEKTGEDPLYPMGAEFDDNEMEVDEGLGSFHRAIKNIKEFLDECPNGDPIYQQIRADFKIRRNGVEVGNVPCTEPISQMPLSQYTDELILLQALRAMYYMDLGQSGHLPWTPGTLYQWVKSKVGGFNISDTSSYSYCCDQYDGRIHIVLKAMDDNSRNISRDWRGISFYIALYAHEARHMDVFLHVSCCGVAGGCDQTYNPANLTPFGIQWWLLKCYLMGDINVGISCLSPSEVQDIVNYYLMNEEGYRDRFCDTKPPELQAPPVPGGACETISAPTTPSGPASSITGTNNTYSTGGSISDLDHSLQYSFDWGDGTNSGWLPPGTTNASKTWANPGPYTVKAQARCASDTSVLSGWSSGLSVTVTNPLEVVSTPGVLTGPVSGSTGVSYTYTTGGSSSNLGHSVQYLFDWGDGTNSGWSSSSSASKSWSLFGSYTVKAQARCATDTSVVSNWSNPLSVSISVPDISVTPTAYNFGNVKVKKSKSASFKVQNNGKANLSITTSVTGTDALMFTITSGVGSKTIKPGKTSTIKVAFKPTSTGSKSANLRIASNDPDTPTVDIPLSGTGQ